MAISPETSSQNGDVGGYRLRRFMLKMTISPETSSQNGDVGGYRLRRRFIKSEGFAADILKKMGMQKSLAKSSDLQNWAFRLRHPRKNGMLKELF